MAVADEGITLIEGPVKSGKTSHVCAEVVLHERVFVLCPAGGYTWGGVDAERSHQLRSRDPNVVPVEGVCYLEGGMLPRIPGPWADATLLVLEEAQFLCSPAPYEDLGQWVAHMHEAYPSLHIMVVGLNGTFLQRPFPAMESVKRLPATRTISFCASCALCRAPAPHSALVLTEIPLRLATETNTKTTMKKAGEGSEGAPASENTFVPVCEECLKSQS